ncbi:MAG: DUF4139 domain-containing protein [Bacteroidota bacterium]
MKKLMTLTTVFLSFSLLAGAADDEKILKSKLSDVTVFLNGAMLHHTASTTVNIGTTIVVFENVSTKIDKESIRAYATNGVKVVSTQYESVKITSGKQDSLRLKKINDTLPNISREIRRLGALQKSYEAEINIYAPNSNLTTDKGVPMADLIKLSDIYRTRLSEAYRQLFLISEQIADLNSLNAKYMDEITRIRAGVKITYVQCIKLTLFSDINTATEISMKYLAGGAGWTPKYDIRVDGVESGIKLDYNASAMNQTGENWENVNITLSTADPHRNHQIPALTPWTLSYSSYGSYGEGKLDEYGAKEVSRDQAYRNSGGLAILDGVNYEEIDVPAVVIDFEIKGKYTLPSNGRAYTMEVASHKLDASFQYFAIPKVDKDAFLLAAITGWEKLNLIEGPTNIYFRETYVGHSYINPQYANDTLDISMGRDNKVIVNRIKVEDKDANKVFGTIKEEKFTYRITVRNTNSAKVNLELLDQIPVSQSEEIKVELNEKSGAELDEKSGTLKWRVDLKPAESKEFIISFTVKCPKNKPVRVTQSDKISQKRYRAKF